MLHLEVLHLCLQVTDLRLLPKVLKWTDLLMMGQSFQLFPEHLSRRDRRIVWLAQDNVCREIKNVCCDLGVLHPRHLLLRDDNEKLTKR